MSVLKKYKLTVIILFVGLLVGGFSIGYDIKTYQSDTHYLDLGDTESLDLEEGKYYILLDEYSAFHYRVGEEGDALNLEIGQGDNGSDTYELSVLRGNASINIAKFNPNSSMEMSFSKGTFYGIASFVATESGTYEINAPLSDGQHASGELMITNIDIFSLVFVIFKNIIIFILTFIAAFVAFILTLTKAKKTLKAG